MATVSNVLKLLNFKNISLNIQFYNTTKQIIQSPAPKTIDKIDKMDKIEKKTKPVSKEPEKTTSSGLKNKLDSLNKASDAIRKLQQNVFVKAAFDFADGAVKAANERINAEKRLVAVMSNTSGMTKEGINMVRDYVVELEKVSTFGANVGMAGMSQLATYVQDPQNINDLGESLYNLTAKMHGVNATSENMMSVADMMGQAIKGQTDALKNSGITLSEEQQRIFEYGTEAERTAALIELVEGKYGGLAEAMANTPEGQIQQMKNAWTNVMETIGFGLIPVVMGFIDLINENMPFIQTVLVAVFNVINDAVTSLTEVVSWLFQGIQKGVEIAIGVLYNLGAIIFGLLPYILSVAAAWGIYYLIVNSSKIISSIFGAVLGFLKGALIATSAAVKVLGNAFKTTPLGLIISLVLGLITAIVALNTVTGGLKQIFSSAFGFIVDVAESAMNFVISLINGVIKGFNSVTGFFGKILGMDMHQIEEIEYRADFSKVKEAGQDFIENFSLEDLKDKIFSTPEMPDLYDEDALQDYGLDLPGDDWNVQAPSDSLGDIGKVGEVGKIRDTVDISSEDIKMMRELAEMKNIQNFVSLTPSVSVQTGDITSGHDLDTIVNRITTTLETQIASGAKGVWNV